MRVAVWRGTNVVIGRQQQVLDLEHYLDVLYRKPGALAGSKPLEQKRQAGLWPASFDQIWQALMTRHGKQTGTRQMIDLLKLSTQAFGQDTFARGDRNGARDRCYDAAAVQHLLNARRSAPTDPAKPSISARWNAMRGRCR